MKRLFLVPALGLATLALTSSAHAQASDWLGNNHGSYSDEQQSYSDSRRAAYDKGFREGLEEGAKDGRKGDAFAYQDEKAYQRANQGYHREYGELERYRQSFRTGFASGYSEAYERFGPRRDYRSGRPGPGRDSNWSRGPEVYQNARPGSSGPGQYPEQYGRRSPAFQNGVNDGIEKGNEDARKRRSFDPLRQSWYRAGDRNYDRRFGPKQEYEDAYRQGFEEGYERGYRSGGYR